MNNIHHTLSRVLVPLALCVPALACGDSNHLPKNSRGLGDGAAEASVNPGPSDAPLGTGGSAGSSGMTGNGGAGGTAGAVSPDGGSPASPDGGGPTFKFPAEVVAKGSAKVLACVNEKTSTYGLGRWVAVLTEMGALDLTQQSYLLSYYDDYDWLLQLALMQNMDCVLGASGCPAILACLNQGQAQPACTDPLGYSLHRRCSDATHLKGCSVHTEATFDCGKLGLGCVETSPAAGGITIATCAIPVAGSPPVDKAIQVTCQGDLARFRFGGAEYTYDCNYFSATCVSGTYPMTGEKPEYCQGKRATACAPDSPGVRCEGNTLVGCLGGRETAQDCTSSGTTCQLDPNLRRPRCGFSCVSTPAACQSGKVSYCGPTGMTTLDCNSVGFPACQADMMATVPEAWCAPAAANPCAQCEANQVCVQSFDGTCGLGQVSCKTVTATCRTKLAASGAKSCQSIPECESQFCASPFICHYEIPCPNQAPEAGVYCYGP